MLDNLSSPFYSHHVTAQSVHTTVTWTFSTRLLQPWHFTNFHLLFLRFLQCAELNYHHIFLATRFSGILHEPSASHALLFFFLLYNFKNNISFFSVGMVLSQPDIAPGTIFEFWLTWTYLAGVGKCLSCPQKYTWSGPHRPYQARYLSTLFLFINPPPQTP